MFCAQSLFRLQKNIDMCYTEGTLGLNFKRNLRHVFVWNYVSSANEKETEFLGNRVSSTVPPTLVLCSRCEQMPSVVRRP